MVSSRWELGWGAVSGVGFGPVTAALPAHGKQTAGPHRFALSEDSSTGVERSE